MNKQRTEKARTLIVTAELDPISFAWLDGLRRQNFPADRNFLSAHLTMFHQVCPDDTGRVAQLQLPQVPLTVKFTGVRFLGRGVAINVACPPLTKFREAMRQELTQVTAQDCQPWSPHVTVQNKVDAKVARQLFEHLQGDFQVRSGSILGVLLWDYLDGPWSLLHRLAFTLSDRTSDHLTQ